MSTANAQTTTGVADDGTATDGQSLWSSKGCSGCHTVTSGGRGNAANAGAHITYANTQGMGGAALTTTERNNIAAYIAANNSTSLATQSVPFQGSTMFTAPKVTLNTAYGDYIGLRNSTNPPNKGTATYSGTTITYTASSGQCGSETFTYEAYRSGAAVQGAGTSSERSVTVDIADPAAPNITTSAATDSGTYNAAGFSYTPTSTGGPPSSYAITVGSLPTGLSLNSSTGAITGTPTQAGTFPITLQARNCLNGVMTGQTSSRAITITINKASQGALTAQINGSSANPTFTYLTTTTATLSVSQLSPVGSGAVTYSSNNTAVCTVTAPSTLNLVGAGTCTVTATRATDSNYLAASDTIVVTVNKANQAALTALIGGVAAPVPVNYALPNGSGTLSSSGGSGSGAVTFATLTSQVCVVSTNTVIYIAAGLCTVQATKATDVNYNAATDNVDITVNATVPGPPVIGSAIGGNAQAVVNFSPPANTGGTAILDFTATCTASGHTTRTATVAGTPATVTLLDNATTYSCSVVARNATGNSAASGTVNVTPTSAPTFTGPTSATRTITVGATTNITASGAPTPTISFLSGTLPSGLTFNLGVGTATITGTPAAGTAGSGTLNYPLVFSATNDGGMTTVTQNFTLTVQKATQTISLVPMADRPMSPVPFTASASASSGLPVSFLAGGPSSGVCTVVTNGATSTATVTMLGIGTCIVGATQSGNASYFAASSVNDPVVISQGSQALIWDSGFPSSVTYSPGLTVPFGAKASSVDPNDLMTPIGLDPAYSTLTKSVCDYTPDYIVSIVGAGTCTIQVDQPGDANYAAATPITASFTVDQAPQVITWGAQASQSFGTGGTFMISPLAVGGGSGNSVVYGSSTPTICTVAGTVVTKVRAGTCTLTANQAGDENYLPATQVNRNVTITPSLASAPVALTAVGSDSQITIEFDPSTQDGGSTITQYIAVCSPSLQSVAGTSSPLVVTGITNGVQQSCVVQAVNAAGTGPSSNALLATPFLDSGVNLWTNVCNTCHMGNPAGNRFNAAGISGNVIHYARSNQMNMMESTAVQALTLNELAQVAQYIATFVPAINASTPFNTPVGIDVSSHLTLGLVSFDRAEIVTAPANGTLSTFAGPNGTLITYTPNAGFVGNDSFTYRGAKGSPTTVNAGDPRTVTITVNPPPAPVITSPSTFAATFGQMTSYQITASNSPTSYSATGLGASCSINTLSGLITCTPMAAGSFTVTVSATNAGGSGSLPVDVTVAQAGQTITFGAQAGQTYAQGGSFSLNPVATASSGLTVSYSSLTPAVCVIPGMSVLMLSAGTCTIEATQAGNSNYFSAAPVSQSITIMPTVPGIPTIGTATPGDTAASISFTAPANNGGTPITGYQAACAPSGTGSGTASPINVSGLMNGTTYTCAVRAVNAAGNSGLSSTVMVTPAATPVAPLILSANSTTMTVGSAGNFNFSASGVPLPTIGLTGTRPSGVNFSATASTGAGLLSGAPALGANAVGTYNLTVSATNGSGAVMQAFTLTVQKASQTITFNGPPNQPFTSTPISLTATSSSGLAVSLNSTTPSVCTVSGNSLTLLTIGTCTVAASQAGNADYNAATTVNQSVSISQAMQTITFPTQSPASRSFLAGSTFQVSPVATASSGLAVSYSSTTSSVCTIVGTTVTMVAPGTCTLAANQSGNTNFSSAAQQTANVSLNATVPGAPTIGTGTPGNGQATIAFTAPSNNGGAAIIDYTATCNPGNVSATGTASPIVVSGLTNGVAYSCSVKARNSVGTGASSSTVAVTPLSGLGIVTWGNVCADCHTSVPSGNQLNGAGTTATVIQHVRSQQTLMSGYAEVQALTASDLADIAVYIASVLTPIQPTVVQGQSVTIDVNSHITLTGQAWSAFDAVEPVTLPTNGTLKSLSNVSNTFTGTQIVYTPNPGYFGTDTFTYRGKLTGVHNGDPQTVTITITQAPPVISSSNMASGTFGVAFNYQIVASNSPTSYAATGLPTGVTINTMTGAISGTPTQSGSFPVTLTATNSGGSGNLNLTLSVAQANQLINFPAQTTPRTYSLGGSFSISPVATGGASGNAIVYGSNTPAVCTVSMTTVSMVAAGSCTITADQSGNVNYLAATQVTQNVDISATVAGAPPIGIGVPGDTTASISFTAPANNGGTPITSYLVDCSGTTASGAGSPIVVSGLTNGMAYSCTVKAINAVGQSAASGVVMVTPQNTAVPPQFTSAASTAFTVLNAGTFTVTASGTPTPTLSLLNPAALPSGVSFNPTTGVLSGTPATGTAAASPYMLNFRASGSVDVDQAFSLTVNKRSQTITFNNPGTQSYSLTTIGLSASATSGLSVAFASSTPSVCSVSGTQLTTLSVGSCTISASQSGNADYLSATAVNQTFTIAQASQTIAFGAQTSPRLLTGGAFAISPLATASSNLAVAYSSLTPAVCTLASTTITPVTTGTCTIAANQAGDGNFTAAAQVTRSITINASVPAAPTIGTATAGNTEARIAFTAPSSNGGSAITGYTATCSPGNVSGSGSTSPILVAGLTNNTAYTCSVTAQNVVGTSAASATVMVTPNPQAGAGQTLWGNVCTACHTATPSGNQLNAAGSTPTVLSFVRSQQTLMQSASSVQNLSNGELAEIALYVQSQLSEIAPTVVSGNSTTIDLASHITLTNQTWSAFDAVELVSAPANGTLKSLGNVSNTFSGTQIVYTPNPGFSGIDTFTYRGKRTGVHNGDSRTITITVLPAPPVITSSSMASGTFGVAFSYTITATNTATSFSASGLPSGLMLNTMSGAITGTPTTNGNFPVTISATNAGGTGMANITLSIAQAPQTINFPAQTSPRTFSLGGTFQISPVATGGASGNPVTYGSSTTSVCTVSGTTVSIVAAGACTLTADQAGNTNYAAAAQATQNVTVNATVPGAPTIGIAVPGDTTASISFTAPASNGGSPITTYTVSCGGPAKSGPASPIVLTGLTNGTTYTCTVQATNGAGTGPFSASVMVTPQATPVPPQFTSASNAAFTVLALGSFNVMASGTPTPTLSLVSGAPPNGVTFVPATGVLSGTPATGTAAASPYSLTFRASNSTGTVDQVFTLNVPKSNQSITFTGPANQAFTSTPINLSASATSGLTVTLASTSPTICAVAGTQVTLLQPGRCNLTADQPGNADYNAATQVTQFFDVSIASQTIAFGAQTSPRTFSTNTFTINPLATASSGLAVAYSSTTSSVCTVSGTTVTMVTPGICTIAANQGGNGNYQAATPVTQSVTINATVPGAPTGVIASPANGQATLTFTAPTFNGGSAISGYTATCNPGNVQASASASPITVGGLSNGTTYSCTVAAQNGSGTGASSAIVNVTPISGNGSTIWANVCTGCHGSVPMANQLNGAGTSGTVIAFVRANQTFMKLIQAVQDLTPAELNDVAAYIAANVPAMSVTTQMNTPVNVSVSNHITLTGQVWSAFDAVEIVTPPSHGTLGAFAGTTAQYTPTAGYIGSDSFTYRGKRTGVHDGDPRTVTITVTPQAPAITSTLTASGTFNVAFNYQITASNVPTSFGATGLPAGLSVDTMTGAISGTPTAAGNGMVTLTATNAGGTGMATLALNIAQAPQSISFPMQSTGSRPFAAGTTFAISPTATGGASGNSITYGSSTTGVCTVSGTTVTMVSAGTCTLTANQAGNTNYAAAPQATQNVTISPVAPGAPTVGTVTPGNAQITVAFTAPSQTGGVPILNFVVDCNGVTATGGGSPITVTGLNNGMTYTCVVRAVNTATLFANSSTFMATPISIQFANNVFSRKVQNGVDRDITINHNVAANGSVDIEPRIGNTAHTIYFDFSAPVINAGTLVVTNVATGMQIFGPTASPSSNRVIVTLTNVPEIARITISLTGVNGAVDASASMGLLPGDVNQSGKVTAADIAAIKAKSGNTPVDGANYKFDINANGTISSTDISAVKVRAGQVLPP